MLAIAITAVWAFVAGMFAGGLVFGNISAPTIWHAILGVTCWPAFTVWLGCRQLRRVYLGR